MSMAANQAGIRFVAEHANLDIWEDGENAAMIWGTTDNKNMIPL